MESWMHFQVADDVGKNAMDIEPTLEIGAGTLNHLSFENHGQPYDVIEPNEELLTAFFQRRGRIRSFYKDIFQIQGKEVYKRIISIATFEHLTDLPMVVAKAGVLMKNDGVLRVAIPNEGSLLWKLGYSLTNGIEFKIKHKLDYQKIMQHEHVNTAGQIEQVLEYFFSLTRCKVMGITKRICFYRFYICKAPRIERCWAFLKERKYN